MSQISLTAPMRSNLLALQNIARQQDIVQNRLATGLKVSSAIDNPSSYYTAASLSNRAADLSALLDAMSQGVQTIKTASEAITSATKFLEQAKATANQALENTADIAAKVSTEEELLAAIASGKKGLIVLEKDITMSENQSIKLQDGQSLVGKSYLNGGQNTSISFNFTGANNSAITAADGSLISNLTVHYTTDTQNQRSAVIDVDDGGLFTIQNIDIDIKSPGATVNGISGIRVTNGHLLLQGINNIISNGSRNYGLNVAGINSSAVIEGTLNVRGDGQQFAFGISVAENSKLEFAENSNYNFKSVAGTANGGIGILVSKQSEIDIKSNTNFNFDNCVAFYFEGNSSAEHGGNTINISSNSRINIKGALVSMDPSKNANPNPQYRGNVLNLSAGVIISYTNNLNTILGTWQNTQPILIDNYQNKVSYTPIDLGMTKISGVFAGLPDIDAEMSKDKVNVTDKKADYEEEQNQYSLILEQFDMLISDASYKGVNLLQGQNLQINFNEDRSSKVEVKGVKADSESLGLVTKEWTNAGDIEKSISELETAINSLRSFASAFGNYYSIVTTRQDFTENLINVLEEGADKLTLADMNEESANMLALQTSQQLAINSLSLASQAAQSVLKLF